METHLGRTLFRLPSVAAPQPMMRKRGLQLCPPPSLPIYKALANRHKLADSYCVAKRLRRYVMVTPVQIKKQVKQVACSGRWQQAVRVRPSQLTESVVREF